MILHFCYNRKTPNLILNIILVPVCLACRGCDHTELSRPAPALATGVRRGRQGVPGKYLVLVPKVAVQLLRVLGLIVAELAFVRFQFIVLFYVLLQALVAGAGEGTLITAENDSLQVF